MNKYMYLFYRTFISGNIFSRRVTGFHWQEKLLELNIFILDKLSSRWSNQPGKIVLTTSQILQCPALYETPCILEHVSN